MEASPVVALSRSSGTLLVLQFKQFYRQLTADRIARLDDLYTQDIEFRDPVHTIHGSLGLRNYLRKAATNLQRYQVRFVDELVSEHSAYLTWELDFAHPSLRSGKLITVRGTSQIRFTSKVFYHEVSCDMGAGLYEHVPGLGMATRHLKRRLARQY